jgi:hypothetical protein
MRKRSSASVRVFYPRFSRETLLATLRERVPALRGKLPLKRVILFGSYASGRHTVGSDIDLLVVYAGPRRDDAYEFIRRTLEIPGLEPHAYTESQYASLATTLDRMTKDGIVLVTG